MRLELQTIAYIEQYLLHTLTDAEINLFEERMATDPDFKNEVELQELLIKGLEHISLQQTIQNAQRTYTFWKLFKLIGMILIPVLLALATWYFISLAAKATTETESIPTKVEQEIYKETTSETVSKEKEVAIIPDTIPKQKAVKVTKMKTTIYAENTVVDPLETITPEFFTIATKKDTIIETQNGIVFLIPENTFVDKNKNVVNGNIQVEIKEAVDSHTIMTSGLSTLFDDKPLETGGMFFIEAKKDGEELQIHPDKEITADIPTQDYKDGMQLFDGGTGEDGSINWTNPKPLSKALIPTDIYSLHFYPPTYLETLSEKGYDSTNKKFTDSLYYSFGKKPKDSTETFKDFVKQRFISRAYGTIGVKNDSVKFDTIIVPKDSVKVDDLLTPSKNLITGLDPLKVKAIWNEHYQQTFIATKAFEERLRVIHQNCNEANFMFDIYVQNLNNDVSKLDSIIASRVGDKSLRKQFQQFSKQRLTNVANLDSDVAKLNTYYIQQQKVYRLALEKTQRNIDSLMNTDQKYQSFSKQQLENYYLNELAITTEKVAKIFNVRLPRDFNQTRRSRAQMNQTNTQTNTVSSDVSIKVTSAASIIKKERRKRRYRAPIRTTGWKNIDRILNEDVVSSVKSRTTTTVKTRKKSVTISYSEYEVSIENTERFDKLFVYLVPNEFNNFIKLEAENNRFTYKLNDLLSYRVHCIAYLDDVPFYIDKTINGVSDKVKLSQITAESLRAKLASVNAQSSSLAVEVSYQASKKTNETTLKKYRKIIQLKRALEPVIFPCEQSYDTLDSIVTETFELRSTQIVFEPNPTIPFNTVEKTPVFPSCETFESEVTRKQCTNEKVQAFIKNEIDMDIIYKNRKPNTEYTIHAAFDIDTLGVVKNIKIRTDDNLNVEKEITRVIQLLPKMTPAIQRGKKVSVKYFMPIDF